MEHIAMAMLFLVIGGVISCYLTEEKPRISNKLWSVYIDKTWTLIFVFLTFNQILLYSKYGYSIEYILHFIFLSLLLAIALVDFRFKIISNPLVILGIIFAVLSMFLNENISIYSSVLGALVTGGTLGVISLITRGSLGMGDAKLFVFIGIFLGLQRVISVLLISTFVIGIVSLILLVLKIVTRKTTIPFGPFVYTATLITIFFY